MTNAWWVILEAKWVFVADVTLEDNADVAARLAQKQMPTRVFSDIAMDGGYGRLETAAVIVIQS